MTFTVTVPWLDVYLYLYFLIVLQAILAAMIAARIFVLLKYHWAWT